MKQKAEKKRKLRNDILLAAVILATATAFFFLFQMGMRDGEYVVISVDGEEMRRFPLEEDTEFVITTGEKGEQENVLVIRDGAAFVREANCPDKICAEHRAISKTGETIVCLPHEIVISVESEEPFADIIV